MLGLCCHYLVKDQNKKRDKYQNLLRQRVLQLKRFQRGEYTLETIKSIWYENLNTLIFHLPNIFQKYKVFRFPSGILPLWDCVEKHVWYDDSYLKQLFFQLGEIVKQNGVRATFHPGQFCSLSSDNNNVKLNSINEIEHHSWQFDIMGLNTTPYYAINVHGGKRNREDALVNAIHLLSDNARSRLTLENDESCYNVIDLIHVHKRTDVPIVFDSHHHNFNNGNISIDFAFNAACESWGDIKPLQHISNSDPTLSLNASFTLRRSHSQYIHTIPQCQLKALINNTIDLDCETKMKNLAIDKLCIDFNILS